MSAPDIAIGGRRPKKYSLIGSDSQQPMKLAEKYGAALTMAKIHAAPPFGLQPSRGPILSCSGQDKFAPLLAV